MARNTLPLVPSPEHVLIVIPAWNEEEALPLVLAEVAECVPDADVLVVNDGSTDRTSAVARAAGVRVVDLPINLGVGGAMRAGFDGELDVRGPAVDRRIGGAAPATDD